jgi:hypothetical protein
MIANKPLNQSTIVDDRTIADLYHAGQLGALWLALQVRLNPWCVTRLQRWIAALLLLDLEEEYPLSDAEAATIAAAIADLVGITPAQLSALAGEIDDIGVLIYAWYEDCVLLSDAVAVAARGVL